MNQNFPASELSRGSSFHHVELRGAGLVYLGDLGYLGDGDPGHESSRETAAGSLICTLGFARASSFPSLYLPRLSHCHTTRAAACLQPSLLGDANEQ